MMPSILGALGKDRGGDNSLAMSYALLIKRFDEVIDRYNSSQREEVEPTRIIGERLKADMIGSSLREKEREIELLREKLRSSRVRDGDHAQCNSIIQALQNDVNRLGQQLSESSMQGGKNSRGLEQEVSRLNKILKDTTTSKSAEMRSL
jgi:predicted RNase H-like nuclease (RuvC/YqgF family)